MKLSIIVPVYNMASDNKLNFCLESLVKQTIDDYELILVDDYSTDNSLEILNEYKSKYPTLVTVIASPINKKQGGAKNLGLEIAKGEWIGFVDSDDWIMVDMYAKLLAKAEETGADMVGCDYSLVNSHTFEVGQIVPNNKMEQTGVMTELKYRLLLLDSGSTVTKIYKRDIILGVEERFPEHIFYEDNALGNLWMLRAKHFEYEAEPLYYYYHHDSSTVHTITIDRCEHRMVAGRIMIENARKHGFLDTYKKEFEMQFARLFYINTLFSYMQAIKRVKLPFINKLRKEMKETFPDFESNPYYIERVHPEEKKLIHMHLKSNLYFFIYYKLLWGYRKLRKKIA